MALLHAPDWAASRQERQLEEGELGDDAQKVEAQTLPQTLGAQAQSMRAVMKPS